MEKGQELNAEAATSSRQRLVATVGFQVPKPRNARREAHGRCGAVRDIAGLCGTVRHTLFVPAPSTNTNQLASGARHGRHLATDLSTRQRSIFKSSIQIAQRVG